MDSVPVWPQRTDEKSLPAGVQRAAGSSPPVTSPSTGNPRSNRIAKSEILRGYRSFGQVFSRGTHVKYRGIRLFYDIQREIPPYLCTVGFAVRKPRSSVLRNRLRRLLRESYRQRKHGLLEQCRELKIALRCVILIDASSHKESSFHELDDAVTSLLAALVERTRQL